MVLKGSRDQAGGYDCSRERVRTMYGNVSTRNISTISGWWSTVVSCIHVCSSVWCRCSVVCVWGWGGQERLKKCKEHAGSIVKLLQLDTCVHQKTLNMKQTISVAPLNHRSNTRKRDAESGWRQSGQLGGGVSFCDRAASSAQCVTQRSRHSSWKAWLHGVRSHRCPCSHASWQMEHTCEAGGWAANVRLIG